MGEIINLLYFREFWGSNQFTSSPTSSVLHLKKKLVCPLPNHNANGIKFRFDSTELIHYGKSIRFSFDST